MKASRGTVTVNILCYNYGRYLETCIQSVFAQTRAPNKILILNDASTDNTQKIIDTYMTGRYDPIEIETHTFSVNQGTSAVLNFALDRVQTDYLVMLGADNYLARTYVEETAAVLDNEPQTGIVYTNVYGFGEIAQEISMRCGFWNGKKEGEVFLWEYPEYETLERCKEEINKRNFINGSALYRSEIPGSGLRYPRVGRLEDWVMWRQAIGKGWFPRLVPKPLLYYRQHSHEQRNLRRT